MKSKNFELIKLYSETSQTFEMWEILEGTTNIGLTVIKFDNHYSVRAGLGHTVAIEDSLDAVLEMMEKRYYGDNE